jgi:hypothetical protein
VQPYDELEVLGSAIPCSMCQQECAPQVYSSVARCLTCRDTVCVAHLQAHNAAHKGHGHKVFFLSNQNLAQFAQTAADLDSPSRLSCPPVRAAVVSPDATTAGVALLPVCSPASAAKCNGAAFSNSVSPPVQWHEPFAPFGSSAAVVADDLPWAEAFPDQAPWGDLSWQKPSVAAAGSAPQQPSSAVFVGERTVSSSGFYGSLW